MRHPAFDLIVNALPPTGSDRREASVIAKGAAAASFASIEVGTSKAPIDRMSEERMVEGIGHGFIIDI
jgi:hypothetical protein